MGKFSHIRVDGLNEVGSLFLARELESLSSEVYQAKYPAYVLPQILPISYEVPEGAESITYKMYDRVGFAKIVNNYAKDFPRVDIVGTKHTSYVKSLGDSFAYNVDELRKAGLAQFPLERERAFTAKQVIKQLEEQIALFGDEDYQITGFLTNPYIPQATVEDDGDGDATEWLTKTPDQIARDMGRAIMTPYITSKGVEMATDLLLPHSLWAFCSQIRMGDGSDTTILQFVKNNNPNVTITPMYQLDKDNNDFFDSNIMVAYVKDPMHVRVDIPMEFYQHSPDRDGLEWVIYCEEKIGGVRMPYPLSAAIFDGI